MRACGFLRCRFTRIIRPGSNFPGNFAYLGPFFAGFTRIIRPQSNFLGIFRLRARELLCSAKKEAASNETASQINQLISYIQCSASAIFSTPERISDLVSFGVMKNRIIIRIIYKCSSTFFIFDIFYSFL